MDNRPDLPELESVEVKAWNTMWFSGVALIYLAGIIYMFARPFAKYHAFMGAELPYAVAGLGIMVILWMLVLIRMLAADYQWKTSPEGLAARGTFRKRFIRWDEVKEASHKASQINRLTYVLRTGKSRYVVHQSAAPGLDTLFASMRQHLKRVGRGDSLYLPDHAESLWYEIPELSPQPTWVNPKPLGPLVPAAVMLPVAVLTFGFAMHSARSQEFWGIAWWGAFSLGALILACTSCWAWRRTPRRFAVTREGIEACDPVTIAFPWSEVARAEWRMRDDKRYIRIVARKPGIRLDVPYDSADDDSCRLVLAVIRRLREAPVPQALPIPAALCNIAMQPSDGRPVDLRMTLPEAVFSAAVLTSLPVIFLFFRFQQHPAVPLILIPSGVTLFALFYYVLWSDLLRLDDTGITKRGLWWGKTFAWGDISEYSVQEPRRTCPAYSYALKDARGKVLIKIAFTLGAKRDRERLLNLLHAKLHQHLPREKFFIPWKANPWTDGRDS